MDGLLHITDMSWGRINHPSEMVSVGQHLRVQILDVNREKERVSLGLKQMQTDSWKNIENLYRVGEFVSGKVAKLAGHDAFIDLPHDLCGLLRISHVAESPASEINMNLAIGQEVQARIIVIDKVERRILLTMSAATRPE